VKFQVLKIYLELLSIAQTQKYHLAGWLGSRSYLLFGAGKLSVGQHKQHASKNRRNSGCFSS